jgi:hypothetical protein
LRERSQDLYGAREGDDAVGVFDLAALDFAIFGLVVGVGEKFADRGEARAAVSLANDFIGNEAMFFRPERPDAGYRGRGVNENAVQIEEYAAGVNFHRSMIPSLDPFDRMLIAQAWSEKMVLLTADKAFAKYDLEIMFCGK